MRKIEFLILFSLLLTNVFCQEKLFQKPNYAGIEKVIADENSEFFYPKLFKRYQDSDSTLSAREYRVLYYGFLYDKSFTTSVSDKLIDSVNSILNREKLTTADYLKIIQFEKNILKKFPFNLYDLNLLAYAYSKSGDSVAYKQTINKYNVLFNAILSTGDGTSMETAYHVISINHEYDILRGLGYRFDGHQSLENGCDYLTVEKNKDNIKGLYFDVNMILNRQIEPDEDELEALWLLDGVPLYTNDETNKIEMKNVSINIQKQKIIDCSGHAVYSGCIQVTTADSVHAGLKYILKKTKNWVLMHPLADYEINGVVVNKNIVLKDRLFTITPESIENVKIVEPTVVENCSNGLIRIKTNN